MALQQVVGLLHVRQCSTYAERRTVSAYRLQTLLGPGNVGRRETHYFASLPELESSHNCGLMVYPHCKYPKGVTAQNSQHPRYL